MPGGAASPEGSEAALGGSALTAAEAAIGGSARIAAELALSAAMSSAIRFAQNTTVVDAVDRMPISPSTLNGLDITVSATEREEQSGDSMSRARSLGADGFLRWRTAFCNVIWSRRCGSRLIADRARSSARGRMRSEGSISCSFQCSVIQFSAKPKTKYQRLAGRVAHGAAIQRRAGGAL